MPSLPPKCSYTTGFETSARAAISSMLVPSKPRSAKSRRAIAMSCSRRSAAVIRLRLGRLGFTGCTPSPTFPLTPSSSQPGSPGCGGPGCGGSGGGGQVALARHELGLNTLLDRPTHVVHPAELLHDPDDPRGGVDLALEHPVPRA